MEYITQNKAFFLTQGVPEKEQSHNQRYKEISLCQKSYISYLAL